MPAAYCFLGLIPAGASSSAFTNVFGGSVSTALLLTLISSIGSVFLIPALCETVAHTHLTASAVSLFVTLAEAILIPGLLAIPLRRSHRLVTWCNQDGKLVSILLLAAMSLIIISGQRDTILFEPSSLIEPTFIALGCYLIFIIAGLPLFRQKPESRIATLTCSAYINTGIGMSLAITDFPREAVLEMVMAQLCWTVLPLATNPIVRRMKLRGVGNL